MNLKKKAANAVKWTSVASILSAAIQLLQIAVLTRFLDKKDFGLMAMALFVIGISQIFIDMGMSNAIIHKQRVNRYQLSTLFWLNISLGILIFIIIFLCAPLIASFYHTDELKGVIRWIAVTFLISPWGQQFDALLKKDLRFKALSYRDIIGKATGLVISVVLAYKGYGVYSLVYASLAATLITTVLLVYLGFKDYRPRLIFSYRSLQGKGFYSFGLYQMGEKILNYFNSQFDTILIGKILGMEALGLYNIAKILAVKPFQIINPIIANVAFPVLAKVQTEIDRLKRIYLKVIKMLTSLNAPVYILIIILAKPLVQLVFGTQWMDSAPILQLLAVGALCTSIGNPVGSLQLARGRADWGFYWNLGTFAILPLTIWFGSRFGLVGVATALAIFKIVVTVLPMWYLFIRPLCQAGFTEYFKSYSVPVCLALISGIPAFIVSLLIKNVYFNILICGLVFGIIYFISSLKFNKEIVHEIKDTKAFKKVMQQYITGGPGKAT